MLLFLKKKTENADAPEAAVRVQATPASEFIPYYCHWDASTLLTKNGELMQTIRITGNALGLDYEAGDTASSVRTALRAAIMGAMDTDKFALWIHTIRKRRRVHYPVQFKEAFAAWVHERWQKKKHWKYQYYNEIYISVVHEGQSANMFDKDAIKHVFIPKRNRQYRNAYLEEAAATLDHTVSALLTELRSAYNVHLLAVAEREGIFYSEPMEFLGHLVNLRAESFPLTEVDMSQALVDSQHTFGFNALETKGAGKRHFAAVLTLKQYSEIPPDTADRLLQAPMEFVISEAFHFIPSAAALKPYKEQKELFEISGDMDSIVASGIDDMMNSDKGQPVDFGTHQISIMVLADDYKQLDGEFTKIHDGFSEFGLIPIREDIKLEEAFWAQLPANFEFIRRKSTINTARIGGFCRLNRFAAGRISGNHWGSAVTVAPTIVNSPYFFNFHQGDNGHTALFDFNSFHDQAGDVLLNFLLAETRKYGGRLCIFDHNQSARFFFSQLGGSYHMFAFPSVERHPSHAPVVSMKLNPFTLEDNPRNRSFLLAWLAMLMAPGLTPTDAQNELLRAAIDRLYTGAPEQRHLPALVELLATSDPNLAKGLSAWHSGLPTPERSPGQFASAGAGSGFAQAGGQFAGMFDSAKDDFNTSLLLHAFDMTPVTQQRPEVVVPVFAYLLHRLILSLDGSPTVIVLHEAWSLVENVFFAPRLESLLGMLKQHNAMVIFTTGNPLAHTKAHSFNTIMRCCPTHLYVPDDIDLNYVSQSLDMNESDARLLRRMKRQKGEFLVKQNSESTALRIDLSDLHDLWAILANDSKSLAAAGKR